MMTRLLNATLLSLVFALVGCGAPTQKCDPAAKEGANACSNSDGENTGDTQNPNDDVSETEPDPEPEEEKPPALWSPLPDEDPTPHDPTGYAWKIAHTFKKQDVEDIWLYGTDVGWAVGANGLVLRLKDADSWESAPPALGSSARSTYFKTVWGSGPNDVWIGGYTISVGKYAETLYRYDGTQWAAVNTGFDFKYVDIIAGLSADQVWVGGTMVNADAKEEALLAYWDGIAWSRVDVPVPEGTRSISNLLAIAPNSVWAAANGSYSVMQGGNVILVSKYSLYRFDGQTWGALELPSAFSCTKGSGSCDRMFGVDLNTIWVLARVPNFEYALYEFSNGTWREMRKFSSPITAFTATSRSNIWAFGSGSVGTTIYPRAFRFDGIKWDEFLLPEEARGFVSSARAFSAERLWIVGGQASSGADGFLATYTLAPPQ